MNRIVCAAIRSEDGDVVLGVRHYDALMVRDMVARLDGRRFEHRSGPDQGFVDQTGMYRTRREAFVVAWTAGQVVRIEACHPGPDGLELHSEGLY